MLREAIDMLGAFKDNYNGDCFSLSDSTNSDSFGLGSNNTSPIRINTEYFFEPNFAQENPFASNLTLNLMRSSSTESPLNQLLSSNAALNNCDKTFSLNFDEISLPELNLNLSFKESKVSLPKVESCTGKFSPEEKNSHFQFDIKNQKIEKKRIQRASRGTKRKTQVVSSKKNSKRKSKKGSKKDIKPKSITDFKRESKNVVKNYGKAMAAFSLSEIATPYLQAILPDHGISMDDFKSFMINRKETIDSIGSLRDLLCPDFQNDSPQELRLKTVFRKISEVFVRDFAVNWVFTSKSQYKSALLNYRFKILRRVMDPASFTFLKSQ